MESVRAVAAGLLASLAEDGWLLLSAADPPIAEFVPCTVLLTPHGIAYRRIEQAPTGDVDERGWRVILGVARNDPSPGASGHAREAAQKPAVESARENALESAPERESAGLPAGGEFGASPANPAFETRIDPTAPDYPSPRAHEAPATGESRVAPGAPGDLADRETSWVSRIRALADQGRLEEAGRLCAVVLDRDRLSAELVFLHAMLLAEAGRPREAEAAARQALYLDRELVMAHILRGQSLARLGKRAAAVHAFENARLLLERLDADAPVPAADGQRAGALLDRVMALLRLLGEAG